MMRLGGCQRNRVQANSHNDSSGRSLTRINGARTHRVLNLQDTGTVTSRFVLGGQHHGEQPRNICFRADVEFDLTTVTDSAVSTGIAIRP
jgi:hypothetical protein